MLRAVTAILVVGLAGCASAAPSGSPDGRTTTPPGSSPGLLTPVSRSHPADDASDALDACSLTDTTGRFGANGPLGIQLVRGMGLVPHARDIPSYVAFWPETPEIQTDAPAWVIAMRGTVTLPLAGDVVDPTCVVIGGGQLWFGDASAAAAPPMYVLPSLAP